MNHLINLKDVNTSHLNIVGGKNASLGEMIQHLSQHGIRIPGGFATTADAFRQFISQNNLDIKIHDKLSALKKDNIKELNKTSAIIRRWIIETPFTKSFEVELYKTIQKLGNVTVAIRSSATAEDLPEASFAGQQETYLNIKGYKSILKAIKLVFASLYTSRAISYRHHHRFDHAKFAISAGIQPMVRSDKGSSGVMFTIDTETGFDKVILINASYGLGESIVQGHVNPDEFYVYKQALENHQYAILQHKLGTKQTKMIYGTSKNDKKRIKSVAVPRSEQNRYCLNDQDIHQLARYAMLIEKHYGRAMDIEWAKDGVSGKLYILQARPETVKSRNDNRMIEQFTLSKKGEKIVQGLSVGQRIGTGKARVITNSNKMPDINPGDVLVTDMTDPDWEPIMKTASAIVTNRGGRTCHAAIVARELGIPAVVGCGDATSKIKNGQVVTVSCAEGETGNVYEGNIPYRVNSIPLADIPTLPIKLCVNLGNPDKAFATQFLPNDGVGLARLEFIISNIGIHPNAALNFKTLPQQIKANIKKITAAYASPVEYYVSKLGEGIAKIAAAFYPKEVIFRFSDFKSNEYANLMGGHLFEEQESNPMIGFRGASRYINKRFQRCFELECKAFKHVRQTMGLTNSALMIPFVRTVDELLHVISIIDKYGLRNERDRVKIYMMCEVPSNIILADEFLKHVDGYSIGSNDLTQLTLGVDRDSGILAPQFDENNEAVKRFISEAIRKCNQYGKHIGICGQAPSDHPEFAKWLIQEGIHSISLNPDSVGPGLIHLANMLLHQMDHKPNDD